MDEDDFEVDSTLFSLWRTWTNDKFGELLWSNGKATGIFFSFIRIDEKEFELELWKRLLSSKPSVACVETRREFKWAVSCKGKSALELEREGNGVTKGLWILGIWNGIGRYSCSLKEKKDYELQEK